MVINSRIMVVSGVVGMAMGCGVYAASPSGCPQDINGDDVIDHADFGILFGEMNSLNGPVDADVNCDGVVDQQDLGMMLPFIGHIGPTCLNTYNAGQIQHTSSRLDNSDVRLLDDSQFPSFDGGVTHFSFEITASHPGENIWTSSTLEFNVDPASVYEIYQAAAPFGGDSIQFNEQLVEQFPGLIPSLIYDSAVGQPEGGAILFPVALASSQQSYGGGVWASGRFLGFPSAGPVACLTIVRPGNSGPDPVIVPLSACPGATRIGTVNLTYTTGFTEGELHHADFEIIESPFVSDLNGDLVVDTADLGILLGNFGGDHSYSDVNNDGVVDTADLGTVLGEFGQSCP